MSIVWKGIIRNLKEDAVAKWMNAASFRWVLGKGDSISFWLDTWCGDVPLMMLFPRLFRLAKRKTVSVRDMSNNCCWYDVKWDEIFCGPLLHREVVWLWELLLVIQGMSVNNNVEDRIIWIHDKVGNFSVKHLSSLLVVMDIGRVDFNFDQLWKLKVPPKVKEFSMVAFY
ncbi:hypothetical protein V6N13_015376 [Hibiscus sabdariffa]